MRSKFEIRAQKELERKGYKVDYKARPRRVPRNYQVDYFGVFDLMAYKPGELRMISIKPASNCPTKHQEDVVSMVLPRGITKEIWRYDRDPKNRTKLRVRVWVFEDKKKIEGSI